MARTGKHLALRGLALISLCTVGCGSSEPRAGEPAAPSAAPAPSATPASPTAPRAEPVPLVLGVPGPWVAGTPDAWDGRVSEWLDRAAAAPHNGSNPELELPPELLTGGAAAFERAIVSGPAARRQDAASALSRHPEPATRRSFWLTQLDSDDANVRFRAAVVLADVHEPADLEPVLRASLAHADLGSTIAVRARDWQDRRAVPALVELLLGGGLASENAAMSLAQIPSVPVLAAEPIDPNAMPEHLEGGAWREPDSSTVGPYRRWWAGGGRSSFAAECTWWVSIAGPRPVCDAPAR